MVAVPIDAADALLEAVRVPGQSDVEGEVGLLEVAAHVTGVVDDEDAARARRPLSQPPLTLRLGLVVQVRVGGLDLRTPGEPIGQAGGQDPRPQKMTARS